MAIFKGYFRPGFIFQLWILLVVYNVAISTATPHWRYQNDNHRINKRADAVAERAHGGGNVLHTSASNMENIPYNDQTSGTGEPVEVEDDEGRPEIEDADDGFYPEKEEEEEEKPYAEPTDPYSSSENNDGFEEPASDDQLPYDDKEFSDDNPETDQELTNESELETDPYPEDENNAFENDDISTNLQETEDNFPEEQSDTELVSQDEELYGNTPISNEDLYSQPQESQPVEKHVPQQVSSSTTYDQQQQYSHPPQTPEDSYAELNEEAELYPSPTTYDGEDEEKEEETGPPEESADETPYLEPTSNDHQEQNYKDAEEDEEEAKTVHVAFERIIVASDSYRWSLTAPLQLLAKDLSGRKGVMTCKLQRTRLLVTIALDGLLQKFTHFQKMGTTLEGPHCKEECNEVLTQFETNLAIVGSDLENMENVDDIVDDAIVEYKKLKNAVALTKKLVNQPRP